MKKLISALLIGILLSSSVAKAAEFSLMDSSELKIKVKDVPKDLKSRLGANYILIDEAYLRELYTKSKEYDVAKKQIDEMVASIQGHERYEDQLKQIIAHDNEHMGELNKYIDDQQKEIVRLQPTLWDKHKLLIGFMAGAVITGAAAYGASKIR